jgi:hypothetical protein
VDGFVRAFWHVEQKNSTAALDVELFDSVAAAAKSAIEREGERLLMFVAPDAANRRVRCRRTTPRPVRAAASG